jgi:tRNA threonylcarbamoyl adenosine modification protein YeaZ
MKILAVEFSSERRSVAVVENGRVLGEAFEMGGRAAIELVERVLTESKVQREEIECIAVGIGPGSYTGIRGGISLAQGWQLAREIKLLGVSSVECVAAQAQRDKVFGSVAVIVDAQRQEFYLEAYEASASGVKSIDGLRIVGPAEVQKVVDSGARVIGPEADKLFANATNVFPEAAMLGQLAATRSEFVAGEKLEPIYLREIAFKKATPARVL